MTEHFTIPEGKEPTLHAVVSAMKKVYDENHAKFPSMYPMDNKTQRAWIDDMFPTFMARARAMAGEALETVPYDRDVPDYGDLMTVEEWRANVEFGGFIDYDGFGNPARAERVEWKEGMDPTTEIKMSNMHLYPSLHHLVPKDATHIVWFNR